jgi:hypothetical protein
MLDETIKVRLVAKVSEKLADVIHGPRVERGSSRMSVGCWGGRGGRRGTEREKERERMAPHNSVYLQKIIWRNCIHVAIISQDSPTYVQE